MKKVGRESPGLPAERKCGVRSAELGLPGRSGPSGRRRGAGRCVQASRARRQRESPEVPAEGRRFGRTRDPAGAPLAAGGFPRGSPLSLRDCGHATGSVRPASPGGPSDSLPSPVESRSPLPPVGSGGDLVAGRARGEREVVPGWVQHPVPPAPGYRGPGFEREAASAASQERRGLPSVGAAGEESLEAVGAKLRPPPPLPAGPPLQPRRGLEDGRWGAGQPERKQGALPFLPRLSSNFATCPRGTESRRDW